MYLRRLVVTASFLTIGVLAFTPALAKGPKDKPGGGGGGGGSDDGGSTAAYTIVPFAPTGVPFDSSGIAELTDAGDVVGVVDTENGQSSYHLDLSTGAYTALPGRVWSVNESGEIAGVRFVDSQPVEGYYLSTPTAIPLPLLPLEGDTGVDVYSINDSRLIVGTSFGASSGLTAVVWRPILNDDGTVVVNGPVPLNPLEGDSSSIAIDINDSVAADVFEVLGESDSVSVIWTIQIDSNGAMSSPSDPISLGTSVKGYAINLLGDVCGSSSGPTRPIYLPSDGPAQSLKVVRNTSSGRAMDLNGLGKSVGQIETVSRSNSYQLDAYIWETPSADPVNLEKLLDKQSGWDLTYADCVTNGGIIGGSGYFNGVATGFIMIPSP